MKGRTGKKLNLKGIGKKGARKTPMGHSGKKGKKQILGTGRGGKKGGASS